MSAIAEGVHDFVADDRLARRNAIILAVTQALAGANSAVMLATGGIVGAMLADDKSLATLPISVYVLGLWFGTLPMGALTRRCGRRAAFQTGTVCGIATGLIGAFAMWRGSFVIFNAGAFFCGLYAAAHQAYRFAAADTASEAFKPKAISWVLIGGIFAGILGPQLIIFTKDLWPPYLFAATYVAQAAVALIAGAVLSLLNIPTPPPVHVSGRARPLGEIARQPRFVVAVACGIASYAMMNMVMTSAPLAMVGCNHSVTDATLGLQWHVIAMYAPSFFTGGLINRFGVERMIAVGFALILASAAVGIAGVTLANFWMALVLLGVGWNLGFIGATTMVTECYRPSERNRVQAFNDFLVFGSMAVGSFSSGKVLVLLGWAAVNGIVFPIVLGAAGLLLWLVLRRRGDAV